MEAAKEIDAWWADVEAYDGDVVYTISKYFWRRVSDSYVDSDLLWGFLPWLAFGKDCEDVRCWRRSDR